MPKYQIITRSTFENVYLINAPTKNIAISIVQNRENPPDFFQKHIEEEIVEIIEELSLNEEDFVDNLRKAGYC